MVADRPLLLYLAPAAALLGWLLATLARRRRVARAAAWSAELGERARRDGRRGPYLVGLAAGCVCLALAGPRWGRLEVTTRTRALDLVVAIDISRSMLAEDQAPSRLGRAVREARRLVQDLPGDRVGLVAFAGRSYILAPLTVDGGALNLFLDGMSPDLASEGGTALAPVLAQGTELLGAGTEGADRVLVLFTDGEAHDSAPEIDRAAARLAASGVRLILVAEGGTAPVRIPVRDSTGTLVQYLDDGAGGIVETARDDRQLERLADAAEAALVPADLPDQAGAVRDLVQGFRRAPGSETRTTDLVPRGWIPALLAFLLLLGQVLVRRGRALVGVLLAAGLAPGARALQAQAPAPGVAEWLARAQAGGGDTAWYNAGAAALAAGDTATARQALATATRALDPALRYRALYNLGTLALVRAAHDSTHRDELLREAEAQLREALLLQPGSARAKWNLELAVRRRPPPPPPSGGTPPPTPPPPSGGTPPPPEPRDQALSRSQAEQILNSVEREERDARARHLPRGRGGSRIKDW